MAEQQSRIGSTAEVRREGESWVLADGTRTTSAKATLELLRNSRTAEQFPVLVTVTDGDETYALKLGADGTATLVEEGQDAKTGQRIWTAMRERWWAIPAAATLLLSLFLVPALAGSGEKSAAPESESGESAAAVAGDVLWTIPDSAKLVGSTADLVATYDDGKLSLREGRSGTEQKFGPFEVPSQPTRVLGPELIAAQLEGNKVLVVGAYDSRATVEGVIQGRGVRPVIVSKDQREYLPVKDADNGVTKLQPVPAGESVLGGLPQGVAFASADSVRVGDGKAVTMTPPTAGAKVTAWVAVTTKTVVAVWGDTVAIHDLKTGAVLDQTNEGAEPTGFDQGVVITNGKTVSGETFVDLCNGYAVVSGQIWCPSTSGVWTSGSARLPEKPEAAGESWWADADGNVHRLVKGK